VLLNKIEVRVQFILRSVTKFYQTEPIPNTFLLSLYIYMFITLYQYIHPHKIS